MRISWRLIGPMLLAYVAMMTYPFSAQATIYRCSKDPDVITLTNQKPTSKDCKKMVLPPPDKRSKKERANAAKNASQSIAGSSSAGASSGKDKAASKKANYDSAVSERTRIINEELELEKSRLEAANEKVRALEKIPKLTPDQQAELLSFQKKQGLYQGNIDLLQKELKK